MHKNVISLKKATLILLLSTGLAIPLHLAPAAEDSDGFAGITHLRYVTVAVKDYDEALRWYTKVLGFEKREDQAFGPGKRWIVVAPRGDSGFGIVLTLAVPMSMEKGAAPPLDHIGKESYWVFEVEDCRKTHSILSTRGVTFLQTPEDQPWGKTQAVLTDLYGNTFVIESNSPRK